ncbi:MAG: hypothetical protein U9P79_04265 [Candidatus Cloacimonadota bacterium]|nr:hypothetical protein [Candidatus Cloacimonadota bacterium]
MKKIVFIIIIILLTSIALSAQENVTKMNPISAFQFPSTLNMSKLQTSQSFSVTSVFSSNENESLILSNFTNRFEYQFAKNLNMKLDLNFVNYKFFGSENNFSLKDNTKILPNFQLEYKPSQNFQFRIEYQSYPAGF